MKKEKNFLNWSSKLTAMKNAIFILGVFLVAATTKATGQELSSSDTPVVQQENEIKKLWDAALGSFQFQVLKDRTGDRNFQIDMSVIYDIEENRDDTEVMYIPYNDFIKIKILPKNQIQGDYVQLELISHVESFTNH